MDVLIHSPGESTGTKDESKCATPDGKLPKDGPVHFSFLIGSLHASDKWRLLRRD